MGIFDIFGKREVGNELATKAPFVLSTSLHPYRLPAHKNESVELSINLQNIRDEALLTSVVIELAQGLGFDQSGLSTTREIRLGYVNPKETKEVRAEVWGNQRTDEGGYNITVSAICHYRNYAYLLNSVKKRVALRVV